MFCRIRVFVCAGDEVSIFSLSWLVTLIIEQLCILFVDRHNLCARNNLLQDERYLFEQQNMVHFFPFLFISLLGITLVAHQCNCQIYPSLRCHSNSNSKFIVLRTQYYISIGRLRKRQTTDSVRYVQLRSVQSIPVSCKSYGLLAHSTRPFLSSYSVVRSRFFPFMNHF